MNSGFENALANWSPSSAGTASVDSAVRMQGQSSLRFTAGTFSSIGISQLIDFRTLEIGQDYVLSANVKFENPSMSNSVMLIARMHENQSLDETNSFFPVVDQPLETAFERSQWRKRTFRFRLSAVPTGGVSSLRIFLWVFNAGGSVWFDNVQLTPIRRKANNDYEGENLLGNAGFEQTVAATPTQSPGWQTSGGDVTFENSNQRYGQWLSKIQGVAGNTRWIRQDVLLGNIASADERVFTVSADIKTTFAGTPPGYSLNSGLWSPVATVLPSVSGRGANIKIECLNNNGVALRTYSSPYFQSTTNRFFERKLSFLLPAGTTKLQISVQVHDAGMLALVDNVQLFKNDLVTASPNNTSIPQGSQLIHKLGPWNTVTEAPEVGTSVTLTTPPQQSLQVLIDDVTNPASLNYGKIVYVPAGVYLISDAIILKSGLHLKIHQDAIIKRATGSSNDTMWHGATIRNQTWDTPVSDIIVEGGQFDNNGENGSVIAVVGDRIVSRNMRVLRYGLGEKPSSAIYHMGHDLSIHNHSIRGYSSDEGQDGIHIWGGRRISIFSNDIEAGDDAIGIFAGELKTYGDQLPQVIFNRNISEVEIFNNFLSSLGRRAFACGLTNVEYLENPKDPAYLSRFAQRLTCSVTDIRIRNFYGFCGGDQSMIGLICSPISRLHPARPGLGVPSPFPVQSNVRKIHFSKGHLQGQHQDAQHARSWSPLGIRIYSDDVGSFEDIYFDRIKIRNVESQSQPRQDSAIVEIIKAIVYNTDTAYRNGYGHDNYYIRFLNCDFDSRSVNSSGVPDGLRDAVYLYNIQGKKWDEVYDLNHTTWTNVLQPGGVENQLPEPLKHRRTFDESIFFGR